MHHSLHQFILYIVKTLNKSFNPFKIKIISILLVIAHSFLNLFQFIMFEFQNFLLFLTLVDNKKLLKMSFSSLEFLGFC
jgi:hypothetical protein